MARDVIIYLGPHTLDLTDLEGQLVDLAGGDRRGLRPELEGFAEARAELHGSAEASRGAAGVHPDVFAHFLMCSDRLSRIDERVAVARKQLEVLLESRAFYVDAQQNDVSLLVDSMRSTAQRRRDPSVLVPFEKTLRYASQIGDKGARTKRRKAEEAAATGRAPKGKDKAKTGRRAKRPATPADPTPPAGG